MNVPWRGVIARTSLDQETIEWAYAIGEKGVYEQLFNTSADPFQETDLSNDPAHAEVRDMLHALSVHYAGVLDDDGFEFE